MKYLFVILAAFVIGFQSNAQNLIGLKKTEVYEVLKKHYPDFIVDNSTVNKTYNYIKCNSNSNDQTLLIFLSDADISTATKLISDYSNLDGIKNNLNKNYKPNGKDSWKFTQNGIEYVVKLKREEWFFTVFTSKKEK